MEEWECGLESKLYEKGSFSYFPGAVHRAVACRAIVQNKQLLPYLVKYRIFDIISKSLTKNEIGNLNNIINTIECCFKVLLAFVDDYKWYNSIFDYSCDMNNDSNNNKNNNNHNNNNRMVNVDSVEFHSRISNMTTKESIKQFLKTNFLTSKEDNHKHNDDEDDDNSNDEWNIKMEKVLSNYDQTMDSIAKDANMVIDKIRMFYKQFLIDSKFVNQYLNHDLSHLIAQFVW